MHVRKKTWSMSQVTEFAMLYFIVGYKLRISKVRSWTTAVQEFLPWIWKKCANSEVRPVISSHISIYIYITTIGLNTYTYLLYMFFPQRHAWWFSVFEWLYHSNIFCQQFRITILDNQGEFSKQFWLQDGSAPSHCLAISIPLL